MARNYIPLEEIVNDYILSIDTDDNAGNVSDNTVRSYALRGIREMGFDMLKRILQSPRSVIGKMLTVRFQGFTGGNIPRFPVGVSIRDYE